MNTLKKICLRDKEGRILLQTKGERILVSRFPEMSDDIKNSIMEFYTELTGEDGKRVRNFLDFNSDENEFCS